MVVLVRLVVQELVVLLVVQEHLDLLVVQEHQVVQELLVGLQIMLKQLFLMV